MLACPDLPDVVPGQRADEVIAKYKLKYLLCQMWNQAKIECISPDKAE